MVLDVSGTGNIVPNFFKNRDPQDSLGVIAKLCHDLMWLDDSITALRTYDLIRAVDAANLFTDLDCSDINIYAAGRYGVYAKLSAALDKRIKDIETPGCFESYGEMISSRYYDAYDAMSVILPGALKYFDLPDIRCKIQQ